MSEAFTGISTKAVAVVIGIAIFVAIIYLNVLTLLGISGILKEHGIDVTFIQKIQSQVSNAIDDFLKKLQEIWDEIIKAIKGEKSG
ncbi:MAG: hypothetical protein ACP6IU_15025 [Candidatus Asgardarchaeia archaeon]